MSFSHGLKVGSTIKNDKLRKIFLCGIQGGMRRSRRTNSLILISDHTKSLYEDIWIDNVLHYVGMGTKGDQNINSQQNKTLANSASSIVDLYLFEVFEATQYTFIGQVQLSDKPYQTNQLDVNDKLRKVWVFPLKIIGDQEAISIPEPLLQNKQNKLVKKAKKLSDDKLLQLAKSSPDKSGCRSTTSTTYERNPYVSEFAKRRANGICQLCDLPAPFTDKEGQPYLETHHIVWLSEGGPDNLENTAALCPNCHRKMHIVNSSSDVKKLNKSNIN